MSLLQALILGIIQGATEFLPISSSGHLVLVPWALGWTFASGPALVFDVLVHWGTLAAVIFSFREDLARLIRSFLRGLIHRELSDPDSRLAWLILLASTPAAAAGLLLKDLVERAFDSPVAASVSLLVTAVLLLLGEALWRRSTLTTFAGHCRMRMTLGQWSGRRRVPVIITNLRRKRSPRKACCLSDSLKPWLSFPGSRAQAPQYLRASPWGCRGRRPLGSPSLWLCRSCSGPGLWRFWICWRHLRPASSSLHLRWDF